MELDTELEKLGGELARMTSVLFPKSSEDVKGIAKTVIKIMINQGWDCQKSGYRVVLDEDD